MDRWKALSQIESCDNDRAVGSAGEVSRYQIKPRIWHRYARPDADWQNPQEALAVVKAAMKARCAAFERRFHRPPTDVEFYVLWNAPAQVGRPAAVVLKRAKRFSNLVNRDDAQPAKLAQDRSLEHPVKSQPNFTRAPVPTPLATSPPAAGDKALAVAAP